MTLPTRDLQTWLAALGYGLDVDGKRGPKTEAALLDFQRRAGLQVDGIAGPKTEAALREDVEGWAAQAMDARELADAPDGYGDCLAAVLKRWEKMGARETEGPNKGAWVRAICKRAGDPGDGRMWCGLTLMAADAMVKEWMGPSELGDLWSPSVDVIVERAKAAGRFVHGAAVAQPGDAVVTRNPDKAGDWTHVAIVTERTATGLLVISGNSGDSVRTVGRTIVNLDTIRLGD